MKLYPDGTAEGAPEELAAYAKARCIPAPLPAPYIVPSVPPSIFPDAPFIPSFSMMPERPRIQADICHCNPRNGGGGVCGCTIGNRRLDEHGDLREVTCSSGTQTTDAMGFCLER